jgi:hypothetical protein
MSVHRITRAQRGVAQIFNRLAVLVDLSRAFHRKVAGQAFDEDNITSSWSRESEKMVVLVGLLADNRLGAADQSRQMPYDGGCERFPGRRCALRSNPSHAIEKAGMASKCCGKSIRPMEGFA